MTQCVANVCKCDNGNAVGQSNCLNDGEDICDSCDAGFNKNADTLLCQANVCVCENGAAVESASCTTNGANQCQENSCADKYRPEPNSNGSNDSSISCVPNVCVCENGTPVGAGWCREEGRNMCVKCDDGFELNGGWGKDCISNTPNICVCENGAAVENASCTIDGANQCQANSCDDKYRPEPNSDGSADSSISCVPNVCVCENGTPVGDGWCSEEGKTMCVKCDDGFELNGGWGKDCISTTPVNPFENNIFYVDANNGNDNNDGLTEASAVKNIRQVFSIMGDDTPNYVNTQILVKDGEYNNWRYGQGAPDKGAKSNPAAVSIEDVHHLTLSNFPGHSPVIKFDGKGGISIKTSSFIEISGFEVIGPNQEIDYDLAFADRLLHSDYFSGRGIAVWSGNNINIHHNKVHDCPNSGVRANKGDYITISNNEIYRNTWWSSNAESAIVFAESVAIDQLDIYKLVISNNTVYENQNKIPYYNSNYDDPQYLIDKQMHVARENYGSKLQDFIIDGSGVYVSRNLDYTHGRMELAFNKCYKNGINGVVVHKTNRAWVHHNEIFFNGQTSKEAPTSRQGYAGLTLNTASDVILDNNKVTTQRYEDFAYVLNKATFNENDSHSNEACLGQINSGFGDKVTALEAGCQVEYEIETGLPAFLAPVPNVCTCENGVAVDSDSCQTDGANECASCDDKYHLEGLSCSENVCTCSNGNVVENRFCSEHNKESCSSCDTDFVLENNKWGKPCLYTGPNVCTCSNGTPVESAICTLHGNEECSSCDETSHFNDDGITCTPNVCPCTNGTPVGQQYCKSDGKEKCSKCNDGFALENGKWGQACV